MTKIAEKAINSVKSGLLSFCRFITANDTGTTGSHQSGFYIPKTAFSLFFDKKGERGINKDKFLKIKWQDSFETDNRAIYYGQGTRNEYRLTRFGRGFPFLQEEYTGGLLIITKLSKDYYQAFVLNEDQDIEDFLDTFGMSPTDTNSLINKIEAEYPNEVENLITKFISGLKRDFPDTSTLSYTARDICEKINLVQKNMIEEKPDETLINWLKTEYELFKKIENHYFHDKMSKSFSSTEEFSKLAHSFINRRMTRAGYSLENQLATVFTENKLKFSHPGKTEGNKKPDFIFPGNYEYHSDQYNTNKLVFLGAKTTCKDRWRQILNEASKIPVKHLFTLQQGISKNQLKEMYESSIILVVPKQYISTYPEEFRSKIFCLKSFINFAEEKQSES